MLGTLDASRSSWPEEHRPRLSLVIPCYNEEASLVELHRRVRSVCEAIGPEAYEVILVNDGSSDGTWDVIKGLVAGDGGVVGVNLSRNHGHQLALSAGLRFARGERVAILDADLQDRPAGADPGERAHQLPGRGHLRSPGDATEW